MLKLSIDCRTLKNRILEEGILWLRRAKLGIFPQILHEKNEIWDQGSRLEEHPDAPNCQISANSAFQTFS